MKVFSMLISIVTFFSCSKDQPTELSSDNYYPPINGSSWSKLNSEELDWDNTKLEELYTFLEDQETRAFIIIKSGKIAAEKYWGESFDNNSDFTQSSNWYWASAAKTITATLIGIAQEQGHLSINDKTSVHLGPGWTNMSIEKENLISIKNQLTMTTGLDYTVPDINCTDPECLEYRVDAGKQWYYHNAPYTILDEVVTSATQETYNDFTKDQFTSKIGMSGTWLKIGYNNVFWSTARDAARFGLLMLNQGKWDGNQVINPTYFNEMVSSSQDLNLSYGYLWWLNGKDSIIFPGTEKSINSPIAPQAPTDMFSAMGKNGQFIDIIPSMDLVVIRMGTSANDGLVPVILHDEMWGKLMQIF